MLTHVDVCGNREGTHRQSSISQRRVINHEFQLALNVDDVEWPSLLPKLFGVGRPRGVPGTRTSRSRSRRSSWSCWRTPAREARSTTSGSRSRTSTRDAEQTRLCGAGSRVGGRAGRRLLLRQAGQVRSRAPRTASAGRSTPCWPTARPSSATRTVRRPAVALRLEVRANRPRPAAGQGARSRTVQLSRQPYPAIVPQ